MLSETFETAKISFTASKINNESVILACGEITAATEDSNCDHTARSWNFEGPESFPLQQVTGTSQFSPKFSMELRNTP